MSKTHALALLYAILASLAVALLAAAMPPLQNADESNHVRRADQISHLGIFGMRIPDGESGGYVDTGLQISSATTSTMPGNLALKLTRADLQPVAWGGRLEPVGFPNSAVYPPFFYLPAAVMAWVARHAGIMLPHALVLMRMAMGACSVALGTGAIWLAGPEALWVFSILLLPMAMSLSAAVTQDGPMLASAALACVLLGRGVRGKARWNMAEFWGACLLLMAVGMARPPYASFALLAFLPPVARRWQWLGACLIAVGSLGWLVAMHGLIVLPLFPQGPARPAAQLLNLLAHPGHWPGLVAASWQLHGAFVIESFIGKPGWLDVTLPSFYLRLCGALLVAAPLLMWLAGLGRVALGWRAGLCVVAVLGACFGVMLAQYLTWTSYGLWEVEGLQGRYFLVPAVLLGLVFAPTLRRGSSWWCAPLVALPALSLAVTLHAILLRYYI